MSFVDNLQKEVDSDLEAMESRDEDVDLLVNVNDVDTLLTGLSSISMEEESVSNPAREESVIVEDRSKVLNDILQNVPMSNTKEVKLTEKFEDDASTEDYTFFLKNIKGKGDVLYVPHYMVRYKAKVSVSIKSGPVYGVSKNVLKRKLGIVKDNVKEFDINGTILLSQSMEYSEASMGSVLLKGKSIPNSSSLRLVEADITEEDMYTLVDNVIKESAEAKHLEVLVRVYNHEIFDGSSVDILESDIQVDKMYVPIKLSKLSKVLPLLIYRDYKGKVVFSRKKKIRG